jgi:CBS-domain-containing membrane protein
MPQSKPLNPARRNGAKSIRSLTCGQVMSVPNVLGKDASVADALDMITKRDWDHLFIVNSERVPIGRIHAVDVLKLIARKSVNRDIAWMHAIPARQLITQNTFTMRQNTPLLKAAALMLTHDLNQLAVTDSEGSIVGSVSPSTVARHLPRFIL